VLYGFSASSDFLSFPRFHLHSIDCPETRTNALTIDDLRLSLMLLFKVPHRTKTQFPFLYSIINYDSVQELWGLTITFPSRIQPIDPSLALFYIDDPVDVRFQVGSAR
jgi:hypothetical protein